MKLQKKVDHGNFVRKRNRSIHKTHFFATTEVALNSRALCRRSAGPTHFLHSTFIRPAEIHRPAEGYVSRECINHRHAVKRPMGGISKCVSDSPQSPGVNRLTPLRILAMDPTVYFSKSCPGLGHLARPRRCVAKSMWIGRGYSNPILQPVKMLVHSFFDFLRIFSPTHKSSTAACSHKTQPTVSPALRTALHQTADHGRKPLPQLPKPRSAARQPL